MPPLFPPASRNVGAAYGFERYDWTRADVDVTNENSGKIFADWRPASWVVARGSVSYSERRYQTYDYLDFVGAFQWPTPGNARYSTAYRQFFLDNRDRTKGHFSFQSTCSVAYAHASDRIPQRYRLDPTKEVGQPALIAT